MDTRGIVRAAVLIAAAVAWALCLSECGKKVSVSETNTAAGADSGFGTFIDKRNGSIYKTVTINGDTWMAENLNYEAGTSWCYDDNDSNCYKYGRLYTWNAAMAACPAGWHLPSRGEWRDLVTAAGGGRAAGKKLKAKSGWDDDKRKRGDGTDDYGFSALPGGYHRSDNDRFVYIGEFGFWWMATKATKNLRQIYNSGDAAIESRTYRSEGLSVRCLRDGGAGRKKEAEEKRRIEKLSDYFTDSRDGRRYRAVKIGGRMWMAENLNYRTDSSWCYDDDDYYCDEYGRLYDWNAAMAACPAGWRLPSLGEWDSLAQAAGGEGKPGSFGGIDWYGAGKTLKANIGWDDDDDKRGDGTDDYGFSALPGGHRDHAGNFDLGGAEGAWWTAASVDKSAGLVYMAWSTSNGGSGNWQWHSIGRAYYRRMYSGGDNVDGYEGEKEYGYSVRCVAAAFASMAAPTAPRFRP